MEFMRALVDKEFKLQLHIIGEENIPEQGNSPLLPTIRLVGSTDLSLRISSKKYDGQIKYLVNDVLYFIDPLKPIFVPINKYGAKPKNQQKPSMRPMHPGIKLLHSRQDCVPAK